MLEWYVIEVEQVREPGRPFWPHHMGLYTSRDGAERDAWIRLAPPGDIRLRATNLATYRREHAARLTQDQFLSLPFVAVPQPPSATTRPHTLTEAYGEDVVEVDDERLVIAAEHGAMGFRRVFLDEDGDRTAIGVVRWESADESQRVWIAVDAKDVERRLRSLQAACEFLYGSHHGQ